MFRIRRSTVLMFLCTPLGIYFVRTSPETAIGPSKTFTAGKNVRTPPETRAIRFPLKFDIVAYQSPIGCAYAAEASAIANVPTPSATARCVSRPDLPPCLRSPKGLVWNKCAHCYF